MRIHDAVDRTLRGIARPTHALPIDVFRVLVGLLSIAYFAQALWESQDISHPQGLIDHEMAREFFPFTQISLFPPTTDLGALRAVFILAIAASLLLVIGTWVKWAAAFVFLVASSTYRWNFIVIFVDDSIFHLAVFWLLFLPVGRTLRLQEWLAEGSRTWQRWRSEIVPGTAVRCFLANLTLIYVVAGLWKLSSPMWLNGSALYAILKLPLSYAPDLWQPEHFPLLRLASYAALISEPIIPVMFYLRAGHPAKYLHLLPFLGLHIGILATLKVPYANLACLAALPIIFRDELMGGALASTERPVLRPRFTLAERGAFAFVALLAAAMVGEVKVPRWRVPTRTDEVDGAGVTHNRLYVPLWLIGIAQSYRLMDWIDDRNFYVSYRVTEALPDGAVRGIPAHRLFPGYPHSILLQAYLHDVTWGKIPASRAEALKTRLREGFASRYCNRYGTNGEITALVDRQRVNADNLDLSRGQMARMMAFRCASGRAQLLTADLAKR